MMKVWHVCCAALLQKLRFSFSLSVNAKDCNTSFAESKCQANVTWQYWLLCQSWCWCCWTWESWLSGAKCRFNQLKEGNPISPCKFLPISRRGALFRSNTQLGIRCPELTSKSFTVSLQFPYVTAKMLESQYLTWQFKAWFSLTILGDSCFSQISNRDRQIICSDADRGINTRLWCNLAGRCCQD